MPVRATAGLRRCCAERFPVLAKLPRQAHLAGWRARPEVNIVAIHDPVSERRDHAMRLIQNIRVYDDIELMLAGERLDFVDVASPPAYHAAG